MPRSGKWHDDPVGTVDVPEEWRVLGRKVTDRRVELGHRTLRAFAAASGLSTKTLSEIESGKRASYDRATLAQLEQALGWSSGTIGTVLAGDRGADLIVSNDAGTTYMFQAKHSTPREYPMPPSDGLRMQWRSTDLPEELVELLVLWQGANLDDDDRVRFLRMVADLHHVWVQATQGKVALPAFEHGHEAPPREPSAEERARR